MKKRFAGVYSNIFERTCMPNAGGRRDRDEIIEHLTAVDATGDDLGGGITNTTGLVHFGGGKHTNHSKNGTCEKSTVHRALYRSDQRMLESRDTHCDGMHTNESVWRINENDPRQTAC